MVSSTLSIDSQYPADRKPADVSWVMFRFGVSIGSKNYAGAAEHLMELIVAAEEKTGVWDNPTVTSIKQFRQEQFIRSLDQMIKTGDLSATDLSKVFIAMLLLDKDPSIVIADTLYALNKIQRSKVAIILDKLDEHDGEVALNIGERMMALDEIENPVILSQIR